MNGSERGTSIHDEKYFNTPFEFARCCAAWQSANDTNSYIIHEVNSSHVSSIHTETNNHLTKHGTAHLHTSTPFETLGSPMRMAERLLRRSLAVMLWTLDVSPKAPFEGWLGDGDGRRQWRIFALFGRSILDTRRIVASCKPTFKRLCDDRWTVSQNEGSNLMVLYQNWEEEGRLEEKCKNLVMRNQAELLRSTLQLTVTWKATKNTWTSRQRN